MPTLSLFSTLIHRAGLQDTALISELEESCWMIEDGDQAGQAWCETEGYPGYTSYASLNDLPQRAPAFAALLALLDEEAARFAETLHWDLGTASLVCDSFWINILGEGGHHSGHIHPGSVISGTVYISMPYGAGRLKLEDPRLPFMMAAPKLRAGAPDPRFHYLTPRPGDIVMWESWLRHEVVAGQTNSPRLSISFNYALEETDRAR